MIARVRHGSLVVCVLFGLVGLAGFGLAKDARSDTVALDRALEEQGLSRLVLVQNDRANRIAEFTTDGCSGGLSEGWATLSRVLPPFRTAFGERPPYESCCTAHDRAYWEGETVEGYARRLEADEALRRCVVDYGTQHRAEFAERFRLPEDVIATNFQVIGDLMYYAVRAGGGPCTAFPWRWGYGWPPCPMTNPRP